MSDYTTRFGVLLPVGAGKVRAALALYARMREEQDAGAGEAHPALAGALLRPVAAAQGWTPATQAGVLLGFVDALIADNPAIADRLRAHLADVSADAGSADPLDGEG